MATVSELTSKNIASAQANVQTWGDILYNVKVYGAKGDGVTDDTSAIQSALDAELAGGSTVFFPRGVYLISANLIVPSNTTIILSKGATIKLIDNAPIGIRMLDCRNSDNIHIYGGGTIDGNSTGTQPTEQKSHGIALTSKTVLIEDILIKNISVYNGSMGDGINCEPNFTTLKQCENMIIKKCRFDNIGRQDIAFESGINCLVEGSIFENGSASAIDCEPSGYTIGLIDGVIINNNICKNKNSGIAVVSASTPTKLQNVTISNNHFVNCNTVIRIRDAKYITISDNKMIDSTGEFSINLYADDGATNEDVSIHGNTITGLTTYGIFENIIGTGTNVDVNIVNNKIVGASRPIHLTSCTGLIVKNNNIKVTSAYQAISANLCTNSVIKNNKTDGDSLGTGIRIVNSDVIDVGNNTLFNGTYGLLIQNCSDIYWSDNKHHNNATSNFTDLGGNTLWHGQFSGTFTLTSASQNISDKHVESNSVILLTPTNKDANTLMASTKAAYVNYAGNVVNTSFRVATGDATAPAGTETFRYLIINE